jgi:hypothetical protein
VVVGEIESHLATQSDKEFSKCEKSGSANTNRKRKGRWSAVRAEKKEGKKEEYL